MINGTNFKKAYPKMRAYAKTLFAYQWAIEIGRKFVTLHLSSDRQRISYRIGTHSEGMKRGTYVIGNQHSDDMLFAKLKLLRKAKEVKMEVKNKTIIFDNATVVNIIDDQFVGINILELEEANFKGNADTFVAFKKIWTEYDDAKQHLHVVDITSMGAGWTDGHQLLLDRSATASKHITMHGKTLALIPLMGELTGVTAKSGKGDAKSLWSFENGEIFQSYSSKYPPLDQVIPKGEFIFGEIDHKNFKAAEGKRMEDLAKSNGGCTYIFERDGNICVGMLEEGQYIVGGRAEEAPDKKTPMSSTFIAKMLDATKMRFVMRHDNNNKSAVMLKNEKYTYVVMPLKESDST